MCACMAAQVKVCECQFGLLQSVLNSGPVCDNIAAEVAYAQIWRCISEHYLPFYRF